MKNDYSSILKGFARIVDTLESKVSSPDNISNWVTQLVGNGNFSHALELSGFIGGEGVAIEFPHDFMPASSKGNSNAYMESARIGDFGKDSNLDDITLILLAYNIGWMLLGKPLSAVNAGRGLIVKQLFDDLKVSGLIVRVRDVSFGGDAPKRDIVVNQEELDKLIAFQCERAKRITCLDNRAGKLHHEHAATAVKIVKTVKKI